MKTTKKPKKPAPQKPARPSKSAKPAKPAKKAAPAVARKSAAAKGAKGAKTNAKGSLKASAKKPPARTPLAPRRADFGAPVDGFFAKQPPQIRPIVEALRAIVDEAAPHATASLKWGMPFYALGGQTLCAIAAHKAHVNLILSGPPGMFDDPGCLLQGDGKTGRHLKLMAEGEIPREAVRGWLRTAVAVASSKAAGG